ncbi:MAG: DUF362 domain-containing protein [Deltaproteobacteria bacterium]|nr:DUF362 domain-containing protein [Deltaproteobacteria bacterium]
MIPSGRLDGLSLAFFRQNLFTDPLEDPSGAVRRCLDDFAQKGLPPAGSVALSVGSRNIASLAPVVAAACAWLKKRGFSPFIVPAMGSHGGGTPEGQAAVLAGLGVEESATGAPVRPGMETVVLGEACGVPVHFSAEASRADYVAVVNRVKPHTKFRAKVESGLCKMLTVGLGKKAGAEIIHAAALSRGFGLIEEAAGLVLEKVSVLFGLALVEDGPGNLSLVEALAPEGLIAREKELLVRAREMMAGIPLDRLDVLVVDYLGKDISGIGMDSNVTGRHRDLCGDFFSPPNPKRIFVRDLSPGSGGNANGIGLADFTTTRLVAAMDKEKTFVNSLAAISPEKAAIPLHLDTDVRCLAACLATAGVTDPSAARVVRIVSTARLSTLQVSEALEDEATAAGLVRETEWEPLAFGPDGNLPPWPGDPYAR